MVQYFMAISRVLTRFTSQNALSYRTRILALEQMPKENVQALIRTHKEILNHLGDCKF